MRQSKGHNQGTPKIDLHQSIAPESNSRKHALATQKLALEILLQLGLVRNRGRNYYAWNDPISSQPE